MRSLARRDEWGSVRSELEAWKALSREMPQADPRISEWEVPVASTPLRGNAGAEAASAPASLARCCSATQAAVGELAATALTRVVLVTPRTHHGRVHRPRTCPNRAAATFGWSAQRSRVSPVA